jgi:small subunit ribosomal protein S1
MSKLNTEASGDTATAIKKPLLKNMSWIDEFSDVQGELPDTRDLGTGENFTTLFEETQKNAEIKEGEVIEGKVVAIGPEYVTVDIGFKCEGFIPTYEFKDATGTANVTMGAELSVYVERLEIEHGMIHLSKDRADIIKAWDEISAACEQDQLVEGTVIAKVKGGLAVDIGVKAFLPGSQIDNKANA